MRLPICLLIALLSFCPITSSALAAEEPVDLGRALKAMNELRVAESEAIGAFINSTSQIEALLTKQPDIEALNKAAAGISAALSSYQSSAAAVRKLLSATSATTWEGRDKLAEDVSKESVAEFKAIADAINKLASTMTTTAFTVYASEGWENSGVNVSENDLLYVQSQDGWTVSRGGWPATDWQGYAGQFNHTYAINREAPLGALLFRIRGSSKQQGSGLDTYGKGNADANGRLEFIINDSDRGNNDGQLTLTIHQFKASALEEFFQALQAANSSEKK